MSTERIGAFVPTPLLLSHGTRSSIFHGNLSPRLFPRRVFQRPQQNHRTRIFALGGAPSQPPREPDEEETKADVSEAASDDSTESNEENTGGSTEEVTADDILNSPSFLKKKLEIVQKELIEAKAALEGDSEAVKEEKSRYVRLAADFENYRRRSMEEVRKQDAKSTAKVCKEILQVLDNFERATAAVDAQTEKEKSIASSYQSINRQLLDALVKLKVEPIDAVGEPFDPEIHEAIQKNESDQYKEDIVYQQFQRGYRIGDTLIRAAIVAVSTGPGPEGEDQEMDVAAEPVAENGENGDDSAAGQ